MRGCSAISDHFLVKAKYKLKISVRWQKKQSIKKINRELLNGNQAKEYQGKLNKYLSNAEHEVNIEELWGRIEKAVKRTSEEVLGYEPQRRNKHWFNEKCRKTTEERDKARLKVLQNPKEENKRELAMKQRENNARIFFRKANEVKLGFKRKTSMVRGENGTLLTENGKIADEFKKMFNAVRAFEIRIPGTHYSLFLAGIESGDRGTAADRPFLSGTVFRVDSRFHTESSGFVLFTREGPQPASLCTLAPIRFLLGQRALGQCTV
ncbi:hypothetical protein QTP88_011376 [Uroleucon formosanum]